MSLLADFIESRDVAGLRRWLTEASTVTVASELGRLDAEHRAIPFRLLHRARALEVFEALDPIHQQELLVDLRGERVRRLVEEMDPDDRAQLIDELPAKVAQRVLAGLSPHERRMTANLLGYPEGSAGRIMSPEVVNLREAMTAAEALARVRRTGHTAETIYALPVTDDERRLVGVMGLRDLVLADPEAAVAELMDRGVYFARVDTDQEEAARLMQEADLLALPVVDTEDRLVGIVTVDDAMEILEEEETEDVARAGGSEPLGRPYLSVSVLQIARSRITWLVVFIAAGALTVSVLHTFEQTLDTAVTLALFVPLVIGTAGNTGAQSATTITRALAVGEVRFGDLAPVVLREGRVGIILGAALAALAYVPIALFAGAAIAGVVAITLLSVCAFAALFGSALPLLARRLGVDPAVVSIPLITALVDAAGLVAYFLIARALLEL